MAKNYDLFLERMRQKYNLPQTTYKSQTALQRQNALSKTQDQFYNPAKAEEPQTTFDSLSGWNKFGSMYHQARTSFETSFLDLGEGVIDAILTGVGSVAQWVGAEGLEDTMRDWTQAEWLSTLPQQDWFNDIFGLDFLFSDDAKKAGRNKEALPEIVDQVASGMGSAVGYGLLNMVPVVGPALAWMGGGGAAAEEALNEGAGTTAAMLYGGAVGGVEFATEKFLGKGLEKAGLGLGKVAGFGKSTAKSVGKTAISKIISNVGRNFLEEGTEEVVSELVDPLLQRFTYKRDESLKELYGEQITAEGLIETFLVGGLTGGIFEGANISMGVVTSGGLKNWDIRQEAQELNRINSEMQRAILKGEEAKVQKLQNEKNQKIEEVKSKFETFVEEVKTKPSVKKIVAATQYETQREMTREDLTLDAAKKVLNGKTKKGEAPKINVEYAPTQNNVQTNSYYDPKKNTVYLNKQNLSNLNDALETIVHEAGHAIHTGGLNTNFVNSMTQDFTDFDSLVSENYKGTITNMNELITYYEKVKGYGTELEKSNILEEKIKESKISKEQAYAELRDNYMLEEIANDIFGKKYFSNLLEVRSAIMGQKPSVIQKIKEAYRKRFTNTTNKPSNYKEVMQIFKDGIEQNYENFRESIKNETKSQRTSETRSKLDETKSSTISEEELENDVDSNGNKLSKEQIEYFKNSAVRDENGNLMVVYHGTFYGGFTIFNENSYDNVVFFTNDKFMASTYSGYNENDIEFGKENTGLYSVYLNIEKPLIVDARDSNWDNITFYQNKPKDYQNEYDAVNSLKNLKGFVHNFFYKRTSKLDYRISSLQNVLSKIKNGKISIEDKDFELELQQEIASLEKQKENLEDVLNPKNIQDLLNEVNKNVENDLKFEFVKNDKWLQPTILLKGKYFEDYITLDFLVNNVEKLNYYFDRMVQARALDRLESNFKTLMTTREIVEYAQKQGKYDGVIIRNVYDYSGPVGVDTETTPSQDVYVTLKSPNQIKAIDNKKPTRSTDIRYKLDEKTTETQEIEPKVETKKVQEKKPEYTKYDLTEYETETSLYKLGADLIVKIAEIENNSTKNFLSKDTPYNLAAKIKEATTYEEANNLLNEYKNRVYLINKYYSQLKDVFNKMKNKNFKTAKIAKEVESRIGAINKYQGISNVKNYVINFLTDENTKELETYVEKLSQKTDEQIEKQVAKRQKQIEKEREEQRLKEEKEVEERRNINAKLVKDNYQKQIDTLIDNYPFEANKDDVKTKKEALETLLNELNYETYQQGLTITKNNEESFSKDSLRGKIDYALKQFEKLIKANEKEAEAIIDKELDTYITHINLVKSEIDQKFKDIGGKADDTKIRLNKRLEDISNSIDEINTLINGSTNDTIGIKDTIENMRSDIKSFAKDIRPYLNKKADELEQLQKEQNEKLDKLRDVLDKKQAEQKEKVAKAKAKEQEIAEKEVSSIKEDYQKDLNELTEEFKDYSKSIDESLKNKVQEKINALNTTNYKDTTELDELFSQYEDALNKAKTADEERIRKEIEEVQKKNEKKPKTEQVKETIKFIRTTVYKYNESAKSIKEKANATQMKVYTKVACEELIKMVENALSIVGAENNTQVRVYFSEGSKRTAIDEMFEAFNTLANDNAKLVERLKEIISRGLEIKMPDYEIKNNRIYKKGRNTFTNVNDFTIQETELGKRINSELSYLIQTAIDTKGSPTILAKKIMERTSEYVKTIQKQQETIDKLIAEQNVAATKIKDQVSTSTTNEELNKVYEEINKSNERITKLEKAIEKNTIDKEKSKKTISKLKENNANLKSKLYEQTKTVEKITKENIELKTNLEGTYKVTRNDRNYINRGIEKLGIKNRLDTATFKKISEYYNKGDFDGVVDTIMEFVKNQKVEREYYDENMELKTEMVSFDEVYSELNAEQMAQEFKDYILDRINNPRVTKRSALPEALEKLAELRKEIKSEKETASELKTIKSSLSSIRQLANNQRKSIFSNNIDKRFKAIAQKLERFSQRKMLSGDFRETLKEFKKFLTEEKFEGQTFQEMTGLEFPQELFNQLRRGTACR